MKRILLRMPHVVSCKDIHCPFRNGACSRTTYQVHDLRALGYDSSRKATVGDAVKCDYVLFSSNGSRPEIFVRLLPEGASFGKDIRKGYRVIEFPEKFLTAHGSIPEEFDAVPEDFPVFDVSGATVGLYGFRWKTVSKDLFGARNLFRFRLLSKYSCELREVNCQDRVKDVEGGFFILFDPEPFGGDRVAAEKLGYSLVRESGIDIRSCLICKSAVRREDGTQERPVICRVADGMSREKYPMPTAAGFCRMFHEDLQGENEVLDAFVDLVREIHRKG